MLWGLLVFTVHRTSISAVFLPHAFVYDYSALVDFISFSSFVFFSALWPRVFFLYLSMPFCSRCPLLSVCLLQCKAHILSGHYVA